MADKFGVSFVTVSCRLDDSPFRRPTGIKPVSPT